jgi:hypothetical protein
LKIYCQIVVRNEQDRYWDSWLDWHMGIFDEVHVFDDNSTDDTEMMAVAAGAVVTKQLGTPGFLEHEGKFRQQAWSAFERAIEPSAGDWVFALDADEFFVAKGDERNDLYAACEWANTQRRAAYMVNIPEVFETDLSDEGELTNPQVRVDGWWGKIAGTRLFRYQPGGKFSDRAMGSGSEPTFVATAARSSLQNMQILHYGYARPEDVAAKYERYSHTPGAHANAHVESIVAKPDLVPWNGPTVQVYYGRRPKPGPGTYVDIPLTPIAQS